MRGGGQAGLSYISATVSLYRRGFLRRPSLSIVECCDGQVGKSSSIACHIAYHLEYPPAHSAYHIAYRSAHIAYYLRYRLAHVAYRIPYHRAGSTYHIAYRPAKYRIIYQAPTSYSAPYSISPSSYSISYSTSPRSCSISYSISPCTLHIRQHAAQPSQHVI